MKLIECNIFNFGSLKDKVIKFDKNLTSFVWENGEGKSTLCAFIKAMFYGFDNASRSAKVLDDRTHYTPFEYGSTQKFGGTLTFEVDGKEYFVERTFSDSKKTKDTYEVYIDGVKAKFSDDLGQVLLHVDKETFERSIFTKSDDVEVEYTTDIGQKLGGLIEDINDAPYDEVIKKIDADIDSLKRSPGSKKDREIEEVNNAILSYEQELRNEEYLIKEVSGKIAKDDELKDYIRKVENSKKEYESNLSIINSLKLKGLWVEDLPSQNILDEIDDLLTKCKTDESLSIDDQIKIGRYSVVFDNEKRVEEDVRLVAGIKHEKSYDTLVKEFDKGIPTKETLEEVKKVIQTPEVKKPEEKKMNIFLFILCCIFIIPLIVILIMNKKKKKKPAVVEENRINLDEFFSNLGYENDIPYDLSLVDRIEKDIEEYEKYAEEIALSDRYQLNWNRKDDLYFLLKNAFEDYQRLMKKKEKEESHKEEKRRLVKLVEDNGLNIKTKEDIYSLKNNYEVTKKRIEEDARLQKENAELSKTYPGQTIENIIQEEKGLEDEIKALNQKLELIREAKEALPELKEKKLTLEKRYDNLVKTKAYLETAYNNLIKKYYGDLQSVYNSLLGQFGKKIDVSIGNKLSLYYDNKGSRKDLKYLSDGQKVCVLLSLRLAIISKIYDGVNPFIILDDPLESLDEKNLGVVKKMLKEISKDKQILYFTCHKSRAI